MGSKEQRGSMIPTSLEGGENIGKEISLGRTAPVFYRDSGIHSPTSREENSGIEMLGNLPKFTQLIIAEVGFQPKQFDFRIQNLNHFSILPPSKYSLIQSYWWTSLHEYSTVPDWPYQHSVIIVIFL